MGLCGHFLETINDLSTRLNGEVGKSNVHIARLCLKTNKYKQMNTKMIITQRELTFKERVIVSAKINYLIVLNNNAKINAKKLSEENYFGKKCEISCSHLSERLEERKPCIWEAKEGWGGRA